MKKIGRKVKPEKKNLSAPRYITIQIIGASDDSAGVIHEGWFVAIGGEVALVDRYGKALRDKRGRFFLQQVHSGENEITIAKRLLRRHYYATDKSGSFAQPIRYPAALNNPA